MFIRKFTLRLQICYRPKPLKSNPGAFFLGTFLCHQGLLKSRMPATVIDSILTGHQRFFLIEREILLLVRSKSKTVTSTRC